MNIRRNVLYLCSTVKLIFWFIRSSNYLLYTLSDSQSKMRLILPFEMDTMWEMGQNVLIQVQSTCCLRATQEQQQTCHQTSDRQKWGVRQSLVVSLSRHSGLFPSLIHGFREDSQRTTAFNKHISFISLGGPKEVLLSIAQRVVTNHFVHVNSLLWGCFSEFSAFKVWQFALTSDFIHTAPESWTRVVTPRVTKPITFSTYRSKRRTITAGRTLLRCETSTCITNSSALNDNLSLGRWLLPILCFGAVQKYLFPGITKLLLVIWKKKGI